MNVIFKKDTEYKVRPGKKFLAGQVYTLENVYAKAFIEEGVAEEYVGDKIVIQSMSKKVKTKK